MLNAGPNSFQNGSCFAAVEPPLSANVNETLTRQ
jgi:hypothetical protein